MRTWGVADGGSREGCNEGASSTCQEPRTSLPDLWAMLMPGTTSSKPTTNANPTNDRVCKHTLKHIGLRRSYYCSPLRSLPRCLLLRANRLISRNHRAVTPLLLNDARLYYT
jgi:hypothetical protein